MSPTKILVEALELGFYKGKGLRLMTALLFILSITGLGIFINCRLNPEVTWFTYYLGGIIGMFISAVALQFWNTRKARKMQTIEFIHSKAKTI